MSGYELLIDDIDGRMHAAVVKKTVLVDLYTDPVESPASWASLYLGKVVKIDTRLDAAIVDLGNGQTGILPAKHVYFRGADSSSDRSGISELLRNGQMIGVQIKAEAKPETLGDRHKLPRLTMRLFVWGQHLLYSPVAQQISVSRRVENKAVLGAAAKLPGKGGWIVQPSAERATVDELQEEAQRLLEEWQATQDIMDASAGGPPRMIRPGPNAFIRALNDYGVAWFDHIHVANKELLNRLIDWAEKHEPALATSKRLRLYKPEKPRQRLFDIYDIYSELESLRENYIALNNGASIIIEPTHAVIMIDVNQGSADSASAANLAAAHEVARQIRLRNLSGAILVDFINMHLKTERLELLETLERSLSNDFCNAQVHGYTRLGIIEITRKRRSAGYAEKMKINLKKKATPPT